MNSIPWYRSQVYVSALVSIISQAAVLLGVSDQFDEQTVTNGVNAALELVSIGSAVWTLIARHRSAVQPITLTKKEG
jgi:hypothetical protein